MCFSACVVCVYCLLCVLAFVCNAPVCVFSLCFSCACCLGVYFVFLFFCFIVGLCLSVVCEILCVFSCVCLIYDFHMCCSCVFSLCVFV